MWTKFADDALVSACVEDEEEEGVPQNLYRTRRNCRNQTFERLPFKIIAQDSSRSNCQRVWSRSTTIFVAVRRSHSYSPDKPKLLTLYTLTSAD